LAATVPVHESVELPEPPVMLVEEREHDRFVELLVTVSVTVPAKPSTGDTVIVELLDEPALTLTLTGLAMIVKLEGCGTT